MSFLYLFLAANAADAADAASSSESSVDTPLEDSASSALPCISFSRIGILAVGLLTKLGVRLA